MEELQVKVAGEDLVLHPLRAAYWAAPQTLLLADLHLGKVRHFRSEGVPVPTGPSADNWRNLRHLLQHYQPRRVLFLGDLFHSKSNPEWNTFSQLLQDYPGISFELVIGNHDILPRQQYLQAGLLLHAQLEEGPFSFVHEPAAQPSQGYYTLCGHLHPGVRLIAPGQPGLRLPAFWFGAHQGILPAFGQFTGLALVRPLPTDQTYVVAGSRVMQVG